MDFCLFTLGRLPAGSISLLRRTLSTVLLLSPKLVQSSLIVDPLPLAWHIRIFMNSIFVYWVNFRLPEGSISLLRRTLSTVLLLSPKLVQSSVIVDPLPLAWNIRIFINSILVYWVNFKNFGPDIFNWVVQLRLSEGEELLRRSFSCNWLKWTARFARISQRYLKKHVRIGFRWWHNGFEGLCGFVGYVAWLCLWETTLKFY